MAAGALLALVAAGCGGDDVDADAEEARPVGPEVAGSVVQYADCGDWREGTREERYATVEVLKNQLTPQTAANPRSALDDDRAYEVLQKACSAGPPSLRLYKIYVRLQGFAPLDR